MIRSRFTATLTWVLFGIQLLQPPAWAALPNIQLPEIGDPTHSLMTSVQEQELGAAFYRSLNGQLKISTDPEVKEYIQSLGSRLTINSDNPSQPYTFFVVMDPVINAFAGPGGYVGVNSGLVILTEQESELASVLAHEISHVTQRHLFQTFQAMSKMAIPVAVGTLLLAILGAKAGGNGAMAGMMAGQGMGVQYQLNFTRDNEVEADLVGMQVLSRSEFDPRAMPEFFERMQQSTRFAGNKVPEFLLTHPVTTSRISDTRSRAEHFSYRQYPDSINYQIIKAKLRVLSSPNPRVAIDYFRNHENRGTQQQQDIAEYGIAFAQSKLKESEAARKALLKLIQRYPHQPQFMNALADTEMEAKNFPAAIQLYELGLARFPENSAMTLNYARALLNTQQNAKARLILHDYLKYHSPDPDLYELLAEIYNKLGDEAESHRYYAEGYYLLGETQQALIQLQLAKNASGGNYYLNSILDERMETIRNEQRENKEKEKDSPF
jgi:predicted Zn-dependent protease